MQKHDISLPAVLVGFGIILNEVHKSYNNFKNVACMPKTIALEIHRQDVLELAKCFDMHLKLIDEITKKDYFQFVLKKEN